MAAVRATAAPARVGVSGPPITVLLAQTDCVGGDEIGNGERAAQLVRAHPDATLAVFPELLVSGYRDGLRRDPGPGSALALATIAGAAGEVGTAVIVGLTGRVGGRTSAAACIDERGTVVGMRHKALLFGDERAWLTGVRRSDPATLIGEQIGVLICFDMEFPELARERAVLGATLLVTIAANPHPYRDNHRLHARARALENRLPHVYVNRVGVEGDLSFCGGSCVIDADGMVAAELEGDGAGVLCVPLPARPVAADDPLDYLAAARTLAGAGPEETR